MTARELIKLLRKDGWFEKDQKGSHLQLEHTMRKGNGSRSYRGHTQRDIEFNFETGGIKMTATKF